MARSQLYHKCSRGSHSSDTSSAYSGSDTMASTHSELDGDELDLTGLVESIVDSDEDDDLAESMDVSIYSRNYFLELVFFLPLVGYSLRDSSNSILEYFV